MGDFDIIEYMSSLTGIVFDKAVYKRIAMERGVYGVTDISGIDDKTKDLLTADLLFVAYTSPTTTASQTRTHGTYTCTVGSQVFDKDDIYNLMIALYSKWNDDKLDIVSEGTVQWLV